MTKFFKKSKKTILGPCLALFAQLNFRQKWIFLKRALPVFKYSIYLQSSKNSEKTNEPFLTKMPNWWTDRETDKQTDRQRWFFRTLRRKGLNIAMPPKTVPINSFRIQLFYTIIWHKTNKQPPHGCPLLMLTLQISIYNYETKKWS